MLIGGKSKEQLAKAVEKAIGWLLASVPALIGLDLVLILISNRPMSLIAPIIATVLLALFLIFYNLKQPLFSHSNLTILYLPLAIFYAYNGGGFKIIISLVLVNISVLLFYYAKELKVLITSLFGLIFLLQTLFINQLQPEQAMAILDSLIMSIFLVSLILVIGRYFYQHSQLAKPTIINKKIDSDSMLTLINNLDSGIIEVDKTGKIRLYNAGCLQILDTNKTLTNLPIEEVLIFKDLEDKPIDIKTMVLSTKRLKTNENITYTYQTGENIRIKLTISPIKNNFGINEENRFLLILRDITKAKNLELQKDEFISVTSHELRTPIAIAEGTISNLELMLSKSKMDKPRFDKLVKRAHQEILFLSNMVNDLSSLSRAQRDEIIELEQIDLRQLAHQFYEKYQPQANQKGLKFNLDLSPRLGKITTNSLYLQEIVQNFITNSIKYTKTGSVKLIISKDALKTTIAVKDTGLGIGKNEQAKIFNKFYRVEDFRTRETSGTGLGLYVSQSLAKKLSGKITVDSRINFGSTFSLIIPNKPPQKK